MISSEEGKRFLKLARDSVESYFKDSEPEYKDIEDKFSQKQGVFVTLHKNRKLRGCIGFPEPTYSLCEGIIKAARAAAFRDPRFPKLEEEELKKIKFEISVLTVPELMEVEKPEDYFNKINIGEDGLTVRGSFGSGLLLPQVFPECGADEKKALEMICKKAMLRGDCWHDPENKFYKFQAQVFSE